jgi:hypothetical protein
MVGFGVCNESDTAQLKVRYSYRFRWTNQGWTENESSDIAVNPGCYVHQYYRWLGYSSDGGDEVVHARVQTGAAAVVRPARGHRQRRGLPTACVAQRAMSGYGAGVRTRSSEIRVGLRQCRTRGA